MCGRFCNATTSETVKATFKLHFEGGESDLRGHNAEPQWNITPNREVDTVVASELPDQYSLCPMRWGIILRKNSTRPVINARSETMFDKLSFNNVARKQRCIVLASGWYEWAAPKMPYYITRRDDAPIGMAGLYWRSDIVKHFVIVTTAADGSLGVIHDRAPLTLEGEAVTTWLNPDTSRQELDDIITPTTAKTFKWHAVSMEVGSPKNNHEGLIAHAPDHGTDDRPMLKLFQ
jgi:putative SOS response-associated peptidase YedK